MIGSKRRGTRGAERKSPGAQRVRCRTVAFGCHILVGYGPHASRFIVEAFFPSFSNRRQVASYAGLAPSPWQSGAMDREQGVSKAGNKRLRTTMIQVAWLWLRHQPESELARWYAQRVQANGGRVRRMMIVALARKLLIALWQFVSAGVVPKGALLKAA